MSRKLHILFTFLLATCMSFSASGQDLFAKANKQFQLGAYDLAIYNYQKLLKTEPENVAAIGNLAEAYFRTQNYMEAIRWYEELGSNDVMEPRHMLNYAHVMKSLGLYDKAQIWYWKYKEINPAVGDHYASSCDHAKMFLQEEDHFDVSLFTGNSPSSDFGVSFYNDKLIYASFRTDMKREKGKRNFSHVQKAGNQLFVCSDKSNAKFTNISFLRPDIKQIHNIGPLSYAGSKVAYTQNNFADGYKQISGTEADLNIYFAEVIDENGDFDQEVPFIHNESGSSTAFPVYLDNGNKLIFASNRIGGQGGFDLYSCEWINGEWSIPVNLGPEINTPGNEITPSVKGNTLYFSSDYHSGIGGYDVFRANIDYTGTISGVENLGKGINSPMDDYYYIVDPTNNIAYFSSTRLGGKGREDIYIAKPLQNDLFAVNNNSDLSIPQAVNLEELAMSRPGINNDESTAVSLENSDAKRVEDMAVPAVKVIETEIKEAELPAVEEVMNEEEAIEVAEAKVSEDDKVLEDNVWLTNENVIVNMSDEEVSLVAEEYVAENAVTSAVAIGTDNHFSLENAKKVAHKDIITAASNVYFIQLASLSRSRGDIRPFLKLSELGNLYKVRKNGMTKIRMGYFFDEYEATQKLREVKNRGFRDAFIVYEPLITSELELVNVGTSKTYYEGEYIPTGAQSNYKIRLASYTDPLWFDTGSVKDIGEIEQWTKGEFTIFILSGYSNIEEAESALIKAINRGYSEAHLVEDVNGYLQKVIRN